MGRSLILITALLITGCNTTTYNIKTPVFNVVVQEDESLNALGIHKWVGGRCVIKLKQYPVCLQHEVRHCIEGDWHGEKDSSADCFENE